MQMDLVALMVLQNKVGTEKRVFIDLLASGRILSYDEYREISGVIRGLNIVDSIFTDFANRMKEPEDDGS